MQRFRLERLSKIALLVSILYVPVAVSHVVMLERGRVLMVCVAMVCAGALFATHLWTKKNPEGYNALGMLTAVVYGAVIVHSLLRLMYSRTSADMVFVGVLTVALALVPARIVQHGVSILAYMAAWSMILISQDGLAVWKPYISVLMVTLCVSMVIRYLELNRDRRFLELQLLESVRREQLAKKAHHDALTGMPNRELFTERLEEAFEMAADSEDFHFAVLYLDLDRFKVVNDSLGPQVGDRLLQSIAVRLMRFVRPGDTVARFGGDEFAVLLNDLRLAEDALTVAERIHTVLEEPFLLDEYEVQLEASIGIAMYRDEYASVGDMLRDADIAMYEAKNRANRQQVFDGAMHQKAVERLEIEVDLRRALKGDELRVYYQPIIDLLTKDLIGFEALIRWQHPEKGLLSPAAFLPTAEETGLVIPLGEWVLKRACRDLRKMNDSRRRPEPLHVSVNLSAAQFVHSDFERFLAHLLKHSGVAPEALWLEITETTVLDQPDKAEALIRRLRNLGAEVCVDDFGIGYSSLGYLQRFPFSVIKLDRAFIAQDHDKTGAIIDALLTLANGLGMSVVAEGLETKEQVALLEGLGCAMGQGYYFAKPMPYEQAEKLVRRSGQFLNAPWRA